MAQPQALATSLTIVYYIRRLCSGDEDNDEEACQITWAHICSLRFPIHAPLPNNAPLSVIREAHRGPDTHPKHLLIDVVVEKIQLAQARTRDILWIECKPENQDTPSGWKNLFGLTEDKLAEAHPNNYIFFIAAVGRKAMLLASDPQSTGPRYSIRSADGKRVWALDQRFVPVPNVPSHWFDHQQRFVNINRALEIGTPPTQQPTQVNAAQLNAIEAFLSRVVTTNLSGHNPRHWK